MRPLTGPNRWPVGPAPSTLPSASAPKDQLSPAPARILSPVAAFTISKGARALTVASSTATAIPTLTVGAAPSRGARGPGGVVDGGPAGLQELRRRATIA